MHGQLLRKRGLGDIDALGAELASLLDDLHRDVDVRRRHLARRLVQHEAVEEVFLDVVGLRGVSCVCTVPCPSISTHRKQVVPEQVGVLLAKDEERLGRVRREVVAVGVGVSDAAAATTEPLTKAAGKSA